MGNQNYYSNFRLLVVLMFKIITGFDGITTTTTTVIIIATIIITSKMVKLINRGSVIVVAIVELVVVVVNLDLKPFAITSIVVVRVVIRIIY